MQRVYVNGRFLTQRLTGVQRYATEILRALDRVLARGELSEQLELELLAPRTAELPALRAIRSRRVGRLGGHAWEQFSLPGAVGTAWLLGFGPTGPLLKRRQIVTMHDAAVRAVPQAYSWKFRAWYSLLLPLLARRSPYLMTVSEFSKAEVVRCFGARPATTRVSGEGWQHLQDVQSDQTILSQHGLQPQRYVLAVGSISPHKNLQVVARALRYLKPATAQVAVVGTVDRAIFGGLASSELDNLKLLGHVSDAQLGALYQNAAAFVHPSLYEGFGIPPLEAMAFGCPVIASNAAAIPEVCGEAALYFSPHDAQTLAQLMERTLSDAGLRETLREKARTQLAKHSWELAARSHLALLREALHLPGPPP